MTDDQGYGVSGTFGGVIPTPSMDRVAQMGLRYTQFHSTALCSPTRAAIITGRNHHSVGFGINILVRQEPQYAELSVQRRRSVRSVAQWHGLRLLLWFHGR
jgi:arylsulfatase A-like enzyme